MVGLAVALVTCLYGFEATPDFADDPAAAISAGLLTGADAENNQLGRFLDQLENRVQVQGLTIQREGRQLEQAMESFVSAQPPVPPAFWLSLPGGSRAFAERGRLVAGLASHEFKFRSNESAARVVTDRHILQPSVNSRGRRPFQGRLDYFSLRKGYARPWGNSPVLPAASRAHFPGAVFLSTPDYTYKRRFEVPLRALRSDFSEYPDVSFSA